MSSSSIVTPNASSTFTISSSRLTESRSSPPSTSGTSAVVRLLHGGVVLRAQFSDPGHRRLLRDIDCAERSRRVAAWSSSRIGSTGARHGVAPDIACGTSLEFATFTEYRCVRSLLSQSTGIRSGSGVVSRDVGRDRAGPEIRLPGHAVPIPRCTHRRGHPWSRVGHPGARCSSRGPGGEDPPPGRDQSQSFHFRWSVACAQYPSPGSTTFRSGRPSA